MLVLLISLSVVHTIHALHEDSCITARCLMVREAMIYIEQRERTGIPWDEDGSGVTPASLEACEQIRRSDSLTAYTCLLIER